jgi:phosphotransferase system HPr-like phosphotransfer protein
LLRHLKTWKNEVLEMTPAGKTDSKPILLNRKPFRALVCLVTLVAFTATSVLSDAAWAVTTAPMFPGRDVGAADGPGNFKELNVDTFTLPAFLGMINDQHNAGEGSKTVIHIQDAHCNYACQMRISEIIEYLSGEYGIRSVNLEGGAGEYDLSIFTRIQDSEIRQKVADYFVKEGLVNGAEFFAINNPDKVDLWGVEDVDLYLANLNTYRDSLKYKDEVERHLKALKHILNNLKRHMYSPEMLEFDMKYVAYKADNMEFREYLSWLIIEAQKRAIDIKQLTNIYLLNQTMGEEEGIDFREANIERNKLIHELQKRLSVAAMEELAIKTVEFRQERISQKDFYSYLTGEARRRGIDLSDFPALENYMVYIAMYDAIEKTKIMEELDALESAMRDELCRTDTEKELALLSKHLSLIENLFEVRLTKEDYRYYIHNEAAFHARNFKSFIDKHAPRYRIAARPDSNISDLDGYRGQLAKFYEYSFKRDEAFVENLSLSGAQTPVIARTLEPRGGQKTAIIVTGGFHTENLASLFRERGVSYVSVMPKFKSCPEEENPYFALLSGEEKGVVSSLGGALSAIQVPSLWNALGIRVDSRSSELARIATIAISHAESIGKGVAIKTSSGDYLVLSKNLTEIYEFSRSESLPKNVTEVGQEGRGIDLNDTNQLLWALHEMGQDRVIKEAFGKEAFEKDRAIAIGQEDDVVRQVRDFLKKLEAPELTARFDELISRNPMIHIIPRLQNAHSGGRGIYLTKNGDHASEIIHELIAGMYSGTEDGRLDGHGLAVAVEGAFSAGRVRQARGLLSSAILFDGGRSIWDMEDQQERIAAKRDYAHKEHEQQSDLGILRKVFKRVRFLIVWYGYYYWTKPNPESGGPFEIYETKKFMNLLDTLSNFSPYAHELLKLCGQIIIKKRDRWRSRNDLEEALVQAAINFLGKSSPSNKLAAMYLLEGVNSEDSKISKRCATALENFQGMSNIVKDRIETQKAWRWWDAERLEIYRKNRDRMFELLERYNEDRTEIARLRKIKALEDLNFCNKTWEVKPTSGFSEYILDKAADDLVSFPETHEEVLEVLAEMSFRRGGATNAFDDLYAPIGAFLKYLKLFHDDNEKISALKTKYDENLGLWIRYSADNATVQEAIMIFGYILPQRLKRTIENAELPFSKRLEALIQLAKTEELNPHVSFVNNDGMLEAKNYVIDHIEKLLNEKTIDPKSQTELVDAMIKLLWHEYSFEQQRLGNDKFAYAYTNRLAPHIAERANQRQLLQAQHMLLQAGINKEIFSDDEIHAAILYIEERTRKIESSSDRTPRIVDLLNFWGLFSSNNTLIFQADFDNYESQWVRPQQMLSSDITRETQIMYDISNYTPVGSGTRISRSELVDQNTYQAMGSRRLKRGSAYYPLFSKQGYILIKDAISRNALLEFIVLLLESGANPEKMIILPKAMVEHSLENLMPERATISEFASLLGIERHGAGGKAEVARKLLSRIGSAQEIAVQEENSKTIIVRNPYGVHAQTLAKLNAFARTWEKTKAQEYANKHGHKTYSDTWRFSGPVSIDPLAPGRLLSGITVYHLGKRASLNDPANILKMNIGSGDEIIVASKSADDKLLEAICDILLQPDDDNVPTWFDLGEAPEDPEIVGQKALNLTKMMSMGIPVPSGIVIRADRRFVPEHLFSGMFGQTELVSVRSSPFVSVPGLLDTYINVPGNEIDNITEKVKFVQESGKSHTVREYLEAVDLHEQFPEEIPVAVIIQRMVDAEKDDNSGSFVLSTKGSAENPENINIEYAKRTQGSAIVSGTITPSLLYNSGIGGTQLEEIKDIIQKLQKEFGEHIQVEGAIESGKVWILQCRQTKSEERGAINVKRSSEESPQVIDSAGLEQAEGNVLKIGSERDMPDSVSTPQMLWFKHAGRAETVLLLQLIGAGIPISGIMTEVGGKETHFAAVINSLNNKGRGLPYMSGVLEDTVKAGNAVTLDFSVAEPKAARIRVHAVVDRMSSESLLSNHILLLLETPNNQVALVSAMADLLQTTEVSKVIDAIVALPEGKRREKADLHMALRTAAAIDGIRHVDPRQLNVVAQIAPMGSQSSATGPLRTAERRVDRTYNGVAGRSIIREGDSRGRMTLQGYKDLIEATVRAVNDGVDGMGIFLVPHTDHIDRDTFKKAAEETGILINGNYLENMRVQFVDQGEKPDLFTQFLLGVEILDYDRKIQEDPDTKPSAGLLRLISAMIEGVKIDGQAVHMDKPAEILKQLFKGAVLITRKIDWESFREQHRAWEAVATSL